MYPVIHLNCNIDNAYKKNTFFSKIKDRLSVNLKGKSIIKELGLTIAEVKLPPNFDTIAYKRNIERAKVFVKGKKTVISPKTLRIYDYQILNKFQKELMAYSVVKSIQLILRNQKKSIKNSCILIYDGIDEINTNIIYELSKTAKFIILLSKDIKKLTRMSDYIIANYGVSPVITNDFNYAIKSADFIVTSKVLDEILKVPTWYIDNRTIPSIERGIIVNDVDYKVPWDSDNFSNMPPELLGAILSQMEERDVEKALKYNGIYLDSIKFNDRILEL